MCVSDLCARDINKFFPSMEESDCSHKWKRRGRPDPMELHKSDVFAFSGMQTTTVAGVLNQLSSRGNATNDDTQRCVLPAVNTSI